MSFEFEEFLESSMDGKLTQVHVTYEVTFGEFEGDEIGVVTVTGSRDELTDFETAMSDEAIEPIVEELTEVLEEQFDVDIEIFDIQVKHIILRLNLESLSNLYVAITPDGRSIVTEVTAEDQVDMLLETILKGE
jgi:nitrogen regulatory protein PII